MRGVNALEVLGYFVKRFVPANSLPTRRSAAHRILEPVFVVVKVSQRSSLRTDVALTEWIVFVTADVEVFVARDCNLDSTDRFAKIAVAIMNRVIHGGAKLTTRLI